MDVRQDALATGSSRHIDDFGLPMKLQGRLKLFGLLPAGRALPILNSWQMGLMVTSCSHSIYWQGVGNNP
jgi:hypothetical protein